MGGDTRPVAWTDVYIAQEYSDIAEDVPHCPDLVYTLLERRHGVVTQEIRQTIVATNLSARFAEILAA
ncbi:MAG: UTRA domain-containing protein, partial [Pikeienuella sp.]